MYVCTCVRVYVCVCNCNCNVIAHDCRKKGGNNYTCGGIPRGEPFGNPTLLASLYTFPSSEAITNSVCVCVRANTHKKKTVFILCYYFYQSVNTHTCGSELFGRAEIGPTNRSPYIVTMHTHVGETNKDTITHVVRLRSVKRGAQLTPIRVCYPYSVIFVKYSRARKLEPCTIMYTEVSTTIMFSNTLLTLTSSKKSVN